MINEFVYFAHVKPDFLKIGFSGSPSKRIHGLRKKGLGRPCGALTGKHSVEIIGVVHGDIGMERSIQMKFKKFLVNESNEWFHFTPEVRTEVLALNLLPPPEPMSLLNQKVPESLKKSLKRESDKRGLKLEFAVAAAIREWIERVRAQAIV